MGKRIKVALVGDGNVGKTSICFRLVKDTFDTIYVPTVFETNPYSMSLHGTEYNLLIFDTAGQETYDSIRKTMVYTLDIDVFVACYSIDDEQSYKNVKDNWNEELKQNAAGKPVILVGTKRDLRKTGDTSKMMSQCDGMDLKHDINAKQFFECSAKDPGEKTSVRLIFEEVINCYVEDCRKRSSLNNGGSGCCVVM